jgi:hypothetical protein
MCAVRITPWVKSVMVDALLGATLVQIPIKLQDFLLCLMKYLLIKKKNYNILLIFKNQYWTSYSLVLNNALRFCCLMHLGIDLDFKSTLS